MREHGSGNIGATNVSRVAGPLAGILTLVLDAAKGAASVWLAARFTENAASAMMFAGVGGAAGPLFSRVAAVQRRQRSGHCVGRVHRAIARRRSGGAVFCLCWLYRSGDMCRWARWLRRPPMPLLIYFLWAPGHAPPLVITLGTLFAACSFSTSTTPICSDWSMAPNRSSRWANRKDQDAMSRIAILGGGSWGTGLSVVLAHSRRKHEIRIWVREESIVRIHPGQIARTRLICRA